MSITGSRGLNRRQVSISLLNVGVVDKSDLVDETAPVNQVSMSGKATGGLVVGRDPDGTNPELFMATGSGPSDGWINLNDTGAELVIGAPTATERGGVLLTGPVTNATTASSSSVADIATNATLADVIAKLNEALPTLRAVRSNAGSATQTINSTLSALRASGVISS